MNNQDNLAITGMLAAAIIGSAPERRPGGAVNKRKSEKARKRKHRNKIAKASRRRNR